MSLKYFNHQAAAATPLASQYKPANPRRGANHVEPAAAFIADFPIGSTLTPEKFDSWAEEKGFLAVPHLIGADGTRSDVPKQSDAWKAHLQRRNELRYRINKAGTHPRMHEVGQPTFTCDSVHQGLWEVRSPHLAIVQQGLPGQLQSLITTKKRTLKYLLQSADWIALPKHWFVMADRLYRDIDQFAQRAAMEVGFMDAEFHHFQQYIANEVKNGVVPASTVQGFLALEATPDEDPEK